MATNSNQRKGNGQAGRSNGQPERSSGQQGRNGGQNSGRRMTAQQRAAKKRKRIIIFAVEIVVLLVMVGVLAFVYFNGKNGPGIVELNEGELNIAPEVQASDTMKGYWNIALFGIDAESDSQKALAKGFRSDSMMIASINMDTGDIKLVSVYRDTYLNTGTKYTKANNAYKEGGGEQALKMLNSNLDLDISDFVSVSYTALKDAIDGLGGVYIEVDKEELQHINNYQYSIAQVLKCDYKKVETTGKQLLDGMQAAAYCRIRYTKGDDFKRAERQREVLRAMQEQAQKADLATLTKVFNAVIDNVYTSMKPEDLLALLPKIGDYHIEEEAGFPREDMRTTGNIGGKGSCVVPLNLESNVVWLHEFLFNETDYTVSDTVKEYSAQVKSDTSPYLNK